MQPSKQPNRAGESNKIEWLANIAQILQLPLQIISIVLPLLTAGLLASQPIPLQIPLINVALDTWYQVLLVICALLCYLQFLRHFWHQRRVTAGLSNSYRQFLLSEVPIRYPVLLIFVVLIVGTLLYITPWWVWIVLTIVALIAGAGIYSYLYPDKTIEEQLAEQWANDTMVKERWFTRIRNCLLETGLVSTEDFQKHGFSLSQYQTTNFALQKYFSAFELEQDLNLSPPQRKSLSDSYYYSQTLSVKGSKDYKGVRGQDKGP